GARRHVYAVVAHTPARQNREPPDAGKTLGRKVDTKRQHRVVAIEYPGLRHVTGVRHVFALDIGQDLADCGLDDTSRLGQEVVCHSNAKWTLHFCLRMSPHSTWGKYVDRQPFLPRPSRG